MPHMSPIKELEAVLQELNLLEAELERVSTHSDPDTDTETGTSTARPVKDGLSVTLW